MPSTQAVADEIKKRGRTTVTYKEITFDVAPNVFYWFDSEFMADALDIPEGSSVLDIGTGTGILAIVAAQKAKKVVACDISTYSVDCAKENVEKLNLKNVEVLQSDLFDNVVGKFDVIIFNIPYNPDKNPADLVEQSVFDFEGKIMDMFFNQAIDHLAKDGKIIFAYASFSKTELLRKKLEQLALTERVVSQMNNGIDDFYVSEITRRKEVNGR